MINKLLIFLRDNLVYATCLIIIMSASIYAAGIGVYLTGRIGRYVRIYNISGDVGTPVGIKLTDYGAAFAGGAGIFVSTCPNCWRAFDYRLNIGFDYGHVPISNAISFWQINTIHTFAFRLKHTESYKIWMGPQIGLGYYRGHSVYSKLFLTYPFWTSMSPSYQIFLQPGRFDRDYGSFVATLGGSLGFYDNRNKSQAISYEIGMRYCFYTNGFITINKGKFQGYEGFFVISYMFRSKEDFTMPTEGSTTIPELIR